MDVTVQATTFGHLRIEYDERVLEPRAWTSAQSRWAARLIRSAPPGPVLELCAGAGHIGLLAVALAGRSLVAVDANPVACDYVRRNAAAAGIRVDVREGPMDQVVGPDETFAVVIADPPWVRSDEVADWPEDPVLAIDGGADGTRLIRTCLDVVERHLQVAGSALLQVGPDQQDVVADLVSGRPGLCVVTSQHYPRGTLVQVDRLGAEQR